jgi:hypothetical protein
LVNSPTDEKHPTYVVVLYCTAADPGLKCIIVDTTRRAEEAVRCIIKEDSDVVGMGVRKA